MVLGASSALRADTVSVPAASAILIDSAGPAKGDKAVRYLNVEGKATGKYACFAVIRFDGSALSAAIHKKNQKRSPNITSIKLQLNQSNAGFTKDGVVAIYLSYANPTAYGTLKYPYSPGAGPLKGKQIATVKFTKTGKTDSYELPKGLAEAISKGKTITLVLAEGNPTVAATWAGQKPTAGHTPPALVIVAS